MLVKNNKLSINIILDYYCNLNCKFCYQQSVRDKYDYSSYKFFSNDRLVEILKQLKLLVDPDIINTIKSINPRSIHIGFSGGEIFTEHFFNSNLKHTNLNIVIREIHKLIHQNLNIPIDESVNFMSNGTFDHRYIDDLLWFLEYSFGIVEFSYDVHGRFPNFKLEDNMLQNLVSCYEHNRANAVTITLTKPNIESFIANQSSLFDLDIIDNLEINISYYIPKSHNDNLIPSFDDLYRFFVWCVDNNHFSVDMIFNVCNALINNAPTQTYQQPTIILYPDQKDIIFTKSNNCGTLELIRGFNLYSEIFTYTDLENNLGCLYCEYYNICPNMCLANYHGDNHCFIKRFINYILSDPSILIRFKSFLSRTKLK